MSDFIHDLAPVQGATDLPDLFAGLARSVMSGLQAVACVVSLLDEDEQILRDVAASVDPPTKLNLVADEYRLLEFPVTEKVIRTGESVEVALDDPDADDAEKRVLVEWGFTRVLICPLSVEGKTIGTVEAYRQDGEHFSADDVRQVVALTTFAANAYARIQLAAKLEINYTETIEALMNALEARDPYTEAHTSRIADMAVGLAVAMQLDGDERRAVRLGAILHDVGKIGISDAILSKPTAFTPREREIMSQHTVIGERMLKGIEFVAPALPIIRHHHERWDGDGYPDGLAGEDIPLGARLVAVCDSFDAMTSDRPYRKAMSHDDALHELVACAATQFDPDCVKLLVDAITKVGEDHLEEKFVLYAT